MARWRGGAVAQHKIKRIFYHKTNLFNFSSSDRSVEKLKVENEELKRKIIISEVIYIPEASTTTSSLEEYEALAADKQVGFTKEDDKYIKTISF